MSVSTTLTAIFAVSGGPGSGAAVTTMLFDSGPAWVAVKAIAGDGGGTGGAVNSPAAASAEASASSVWVSPGSKLDAQADFSCSVEPVNCNAESGTNFWPPCESVKLIGVEPTTSTWVAAIAELRSGNRVRRPRSANQGVTGASPQRHTQAKVYDSTGTELAMDRTAVAGHLTRDGHMAAVSGSVGPTLRARAALPCPLPVVAHRRRPSIPRENQPAEESVLVTAQRPLYAGL